MRKEMVSVFLGLFLFLVCAPLVMAQTQAPKDDRKHTTVGKYATAAEAYELWKAGPDKVKLLDVRTVEEYSLIGHAPSAQNIPSMLWTGRWTPERKEYALENNPDFEALVKKKFAPDDTILVMCRSGHRSAAAVNRMAKVGFTNVYNIVDGFEGEAITNEDSYNKGKRMLNGWKNSGAPWTYALDGDLVYIPEK